MPIIGISDPINQSQPTISHGFDFLKRKTMILIKINRDKESRTGQSGFTGEYG
jgi:hypothetical protein